MADKSTLQSIVENLRDAAVEFTKGFRTPATVPAALRDLLVKLGIANPGNSVSDGLDTVARSWGDIGRQLENTTIEFTDPARMIALLSDKADAVKQNIDRILNVPDAVWNGLGASGAAIKSVFPKRLMDYIVYEALTRSHPKIGGAFLLFGVLRKEFTPGRRESRLRRCRHPGLRRRAADPRPHEPSAGDPRCAQVGDGRLQRTSARGRVWSCCSASSRARSGGQRTTCFRSRTSSRSCR